MKRRKKPADEGETWASSLEQVERPASMPQMQNSRGTVLVRIFERESKKREAFQIEFASQIGDLYACSEGDCSFVYATEELLERAGEASDSEPDIVVRFLVHHYLHIIRDAAKDADRRMALDRVSEILSPPKDRVSEGRADGVLSPESFEQLMADVSVPESGDES